MPRTARSGRRGGGWGALATWPPPPRPMRRTTAVAVAGTFGARSGLMWEERGCLPAARRSGAAARCWTPWEPAGASEQARAARGKGCPFCWPPRPGPRCRRRWTRPRCRRFLRRPRSTFLLGAWETACGPAAPEPWLGTAAVGSLPRSRDCRWTRPPPALSGGRLPASIISSRERLVRRAGLAAGVDVFILSR